MSIYQLLICFPFPIILALVLNYCPSYRLKKVTQTVTYIPHFLSVVVLVGMMFIFFSPGTGVVNNLIRSAGGEPIDFLGSAKLFPHMFVWSACWQNVGWGSIIYMSALSGVSQEVHEAAIVDGATKLQRIFHVDLPALLPTIITLLILNSGQIMSVGYEKVYLLQSAGNLTTSEIISTYVYKIGIQGAQYSYATAIGLFNNVINMIIILVVNKISDKLTGAGLWYLILMGMFTCYNMIIARTFFANSLPKELLEAASIDGCGNTRFFFTIALPLSKAIVAVIALYIGVMYWNNYFTALIYVTKREYFPLQLILREILVLGQQLAQGGEGADVDAILEMQKISESIKYGVILVSMLPVMLVYPFVQKYFVQGVMIGSVKG